MTLAPVLFNEYSEFCLFALGSFSDPKPQVSN